MGDEGTYPYTIPTLVRPEDAPHIAVIVLPNEGGVWKTETLDFEQYTANPRRKSGSITVRDVDSLITYLNAQKEEGTLAFADTAGGIKAFINHHDAEAAGWRDHIATLAREQTTAYKRWTAANGQWMKQEAFAEFLESRMGEIVSPDGAQLLEIAQFFTANTTVGFSSSKLLSNGRVQFQYIENIEEKSGRAGDLTVPTEFTVLLRPYKDARLPAAGQPDPEQFLVNARLRYRLAQNAVTLAFILGEELELFLGGLHNAAIDRVIAETGVTVLRGANASHE